MNAEEKREILETYTWIKVKAFKTNEQQSWEERFKALEEHHLEETNFLIKKVRDLAEQMPTF